MHPIYVSGFFIFNILSLCNLHFASGAYCEDWTICQHVFCAAPLGPCPEEKPHLIFDDCGCCQHCSETPKSGLCGKCTDILCKESYPTCHGENSTVSLDYCGCCRVCKLIVGAGQDCVRDGPSFSVCAAGLRCINGTCSNNYVL
ncbi:unnamed protein product [Ceutorhynchus assimilis]|uniref:Uncharacterized protein n=1 Tax=Ceutorhynchus assimilis TaxID=467358 RepID=A0A9N9MTT1_9CUCU|nr:unnamed protein product [Ceutorhynchus assimilis]